ncbi:hypothetical protein M3Y95_00844300 [Aphelenchoides besseyi]|nr:hypothetical protein M3Y95_00844300 [Aphelenchoides besseyi]
MSKMDDNRTIHVFYGSKFPIVSPFCSQLPHLRVSNWCKYPGLLVEIINVITKEVGLKIVPFTYSDLNLTYSGNFVRNEMNSVIDNPMIDLIASPYQKTALRDKQYSLTHPIYQVSTRALKRQRISRYEHIWSFFETYSSATWIALGLAWIMQWILCVLIRQVETQLKRRKGPDILESAWQVLKVGMMQPEKVHFTLRSGKFAFFVFTLLQGTVLLRVFSSVILGSMLHWIFEIDSITEIIYHIQRGDYCLVVHNTEWTEQLLNISRAFWFSAPLLRALEKNPMKIADSDETALRMVETEPAILLHLVDEPSYYESLHHCGLEAFDDDMPVLDAHLLMRKNHPLLPLINRGIDANFATIRRIMGKYMAYMDTLNVCDDDNRAKYKQPLGENEVAL